jgi:hypothetical protein
VGDFETNKLTLAMCLPLLQNNDSLR